MIVIRWNDTSAVTVLSISQVARWSKAQERQFHIPQPKAKAEYYQGMDGVDSLDQNVGAYRVSVRSNKW